MSDEIEAFGALGTASLAASELDRPSVRRRLVREPAAKIGVFEVFRRAPAAVAACDHAPATCANCDTMLAGDFCHACGQSAHVHRSVGHALEEFLHGIWHFDSKAWRTLPFLAFRPGRLTYDYVHGKRARYIAPLALFLLSIFLMFFVFGFVGSPDVGRVFADARSGDEVGDARIEVVDAKNEVADATRERAKAIADNDLDDRRAADAALASSRKTLAEAQAALAKAVADARAVPAMPVKAKPVVKNWQEYIADGARSGKFKINTGSASIDANINKALLNPEFAFYRVEQKAYKLSFLLVPLSLPFLWLLFCWRRGVTLYDHVVFSLYSLSFMSLLFVFAVLLMKGSAAVGAMGGPVIGSTGLLMLVPPVHIFAQLKGGYRLTTWGALWRTLVLSQLTVLILASFVALIVIAGLAD